MAVASLVAAACGDDNGDNNGDNNDNGNVNGNQVTVPISIGIGPGISVVEAIASDLPGPLPVNGFLVVKNDRVRLCELLAESFPPQCGGSVLVVEGLDLTTMGGLTSEGLGTWSDQTVQILGGGRGRDSDRRGKSPIDVGDPV